MTLTDKTAWLKQYDDTKEKFMWFIDLQEDCGCKRMLNEARKNNDPGKMISVLNDIWFRLPDGTFNIRVNPPGWQQFLTLLNLNYEKTSIFYHVIARR